MKGNKGNNNMSLNVNTEARIVLGVSPLNTDMRDSLPVNKFQAGIKDEKKQGLNSTIQYIYSSLPLKQEHLQKQNIIEITPTLPQNPTSFSKQKSKSKILQNIKNPKKHTITHTSTSKQKQKTPHFQRLHRDRTILFVDQRDWYGLEEKEERRLERFRMEESRCYCIGEVAYIPESFQKLRDRIVARRDHYPLK